MTCRASSQRPVKSLQHMTCKVLSVHRETFNFYDSDAWLCRTKSSNLWYAGRLHQNVIATPALTSSVRPHQTLAIQLLTCRCMAFIVQFACRYHLEFIGPFSCRYCTTNTGHFYVCTHHLLCLWRGIFYQHLVLVDVSDSYVQCIHCFVVTTVPSLE